MSAAGDRLRVAILGGGAWGTALALVAGRAGHDVGLWARDPATVNAIRENGENPRYLPGLKLDAAVKATLDPAEALAGTDLVVSAIPAQHMRQALSDLAAHMPDGITVVLSAKGIEQDTGKLLSSVVEDVLPGHAVAALSGPSFAADVARGLPTAVVIAADESKRADEIARHLSTERFRCYSSDDLIGVEIGGALKNVLAIAAGTVTGAGLGASAQAAMVTRGFVELRRLGEAFGARRETLMGLSGLGDLLLTCSTPQSRNFSYGLALGRGEPLSGLPLAEGVATTAVAARLARDNGLDAPIIDVTERLLQGTMTVEEAVSRLMRRPLRSEDE